MILRKTYETVEVDGQDILVNLHFFFALEAFPNSLFKKKKKNTEIF